MLKLHDKVHFKEPTAFRVYEIINFSKGDVDLPILFHKDTGAFLAKTNELIVEDEDGL